MITIIFIGTLIGLVLAIVSNLFVSGVQYFSSQRADSQLFLFSLHDLNINFSSLIFLWLAAAVVVLVRYLSNIESWAGPAESIYAAHQVHEPLNIKRGLASTFAAFTSASGGASVGQYGPVVHFGATMGIWVKRFVSSRLSHEIYLGCGVAAAIAAGFNAPLAGVVFAHEAILRHFSMRTIAPITVSAVSASAFSNFVLPKNATFEIDPLIPSLTEILPTLVLFSPLFSLVAIIFMLSLREAANRANRSNLSPVTLTFIAATICGTVGIWVPEILGLGIGPVNDMLSGEYTIKLLVVVLIFKIAMTAVCLGSGLFGGVFSPSIFIGVAAGSLTGQLLVSFGYPDIATVVGIAAMAAVSSAVIGAPIASVLIVLELTQSYEYAVAAMMAVTLCGLITNRVFDQSYFDRQLKDRGILINMGREWIALNHAKVSDYINPKFLRVSKNIQCDELLEDMQAMGVSEAYLIDAEGLLVKKLELLDVIAAGIEPVRDVRCETPIILMSDDSLDIAMQKVSKFVGESLPVIDKESSKMLGTLTEGELFQAILKIQSQVRKMERT